MFKLIHTLLAILLLMPPVFASSQEVQKEISAPQLTVTKPFFIIRHGQTDYNAKGMVQGGVDVPINHEGKGQTLKAAQSLKGLGIKKIYSSNLKRAKETAEIIRKELQIKDPIIVEAGLNERNLGSLEGHSILSNAWNIITGGPPSGVETETEFTNRVLRAFQKILNKNEDGVIIVSHGGTMKVLLKHIGLPRSNIDNAAPMKVIPPSSSDKQWNIEDLKDKEEKKS